MRPFKLCLVSLLVATALGAQVAPGKAATEARKGRRATAEALRDHPDLRRDFDFMWFGGEPSVEYLDYRKARAREEQARWARTLPGAEGDPSAIPAAGASWTNLGPRKSTFSVYSGSAPTFPDVDAGRLAMVGILTHPTNPQILYQATSGGGLWKTTNADLLASGDWTWTPVTDNLPAATTTGNVSIGAAAMSPVDPETLFIALGDFQNAAGRGIYRSTNGGASWTELGAVGSTTRVTSLLALTGSTLLVGGNAGLWRSVDGGATFSNLSLGGSTTGMIWSIQPVGASLTNLVATREIGTTGTFWYSSDGGASWTQAGLDGLASAQSPGRATVRGTASSSTIVYAIAENSATTLFARGVFKSTDAGHTWTYLAAPTATGGLFQPFNLSGDGDQAFYNHCLAVDPGDASRLFIGTNLSLYRSMDGGLSWTQMTSWNSTNLPYAHADFHTGAWSQTGPRTLFLGNDGGLCVVRDPFRPTPPFTADPNAFATVDVTFVDNRRNRGITSHLVYHLGSSTASSPAGTADRITLGLQDLSSRIRVDEGTGLQNSSTWNDPTGTGDGFGTLIHAANGDKMMVSSYYARPKRSTDGGATWSSASSGIAEAGSSANAPFHTQLHPGRTDATGNTLFTATNLKIYKSADWTATPWSALAMAGFGGTLIRNFNTSASNGNALAIAANGGRVWVSSDGGASWTNPAGGDVTGGVQNLSYVWFDTSNDQVLYLASVTQGAVSHLWKSVNGGNSFNPIDVSNGFPFGIPVHVIQNDPANPSRLLAGTDFGVYISENAGGTWARYGVGLPMVAVRDLYLAPDGSFVRAATFGRGVWEIRGAAAPGPTITTQPQSQTVTEGQTATFNVVATGSGALSYQWKKGLANVGTNASSYTTPATVLADNGASFTVAVTDSLGTTVSNPAILNVNSAGGGTTQLLQNPGFESGLPPWVQSNSFIVTADDSKAHAGTNFGWLGGYESPTTDSLYQQVAIPANASSVSLTFWMNINNGPTPPGMATNILTIKVRNSSGGDLATLATFSNLDAGGGYLQRGPYSLTAYAGQTIQLYFTSVQPGTFYTNFWVDDFVLNATTSAATAPFITAHPQSLTVNAGQDAVFNVTATGTAPLSYQWRKNSVNLGVAGPFTSFSVLGAQAVDAGIYDVVVTNSAGTATSNPATLTVNVPATPPAITGQPASQTVTAGQATSFTVVATGSAPLAYQWRRNGTNIPGATGATYAFTATYADNGAQYSVFVSNGAGNATSNNAVLTVNVKNRDLSGDGQTNVLDLATFMAAYSGPGLPTSNPAADLDGDGDCDDADLALLLAAI